MSLAILHSRAQSGIDAPPVTIEVFLSGGLPTFNVVGLAETAVRESKDRVRGAIMSSGFKFPQEKITVNLGPADMPKSGGRFDLPIALGILIASKQVNSDGTSTAEYFGELALNGELRRVPGMLPAAIKAAVAGHQVTVPVANGDEACLAHDKVIVARSLLQVTSHLNEPDQVTYVETISPGKTASHGPDLADVKGQQLAKRGLEIAAAGGHNILFIGPPGTGKSMLAQRLPGILPQMTIDEAIETSAVNSVLGRDVNADFWQQRPFRAPHHTASAAALVGGGSDPRPGEISRAHNGVLFLDELPEFNRHVLEVLREPMESGKITISRAGRQADFPARFQLVAAMNPCPCGYLGDPRGDCRCSAVAVCRYRSKISGPLLDRIDLQLQVARPPANVMRPDALLGEPSADVAMRIAAARKIQGERSGVCNAVLEGNALKQAFVAATPCWTLLENAMDRLALSARAYQRVQRVARTIADLQGALTIDVSHVSEAISLRQFARDRSIGHPS